MAASQHLSRWDMILADYREPQQVIKGLEALGLDVVRTTLTFGDYWLVHDNAIVPVERKAANDLISSMNTGRLSTQLMAALNEFPVVFLLIEGFVNADKSGSVSVYGMGTIDMPYTAVSNYLLTVQAAGVYILTSPAVRMTPAVLSAAHYWLTKDRHTALLSRPKIIEVDSRHAAVQVLTGFPGVGPKTAKKALERAGNLRNVLTADRKNMVKYFGKKTGERVFRILNATMEADT